MSDAFVATNHKGKITYANPGAVKLFRQRKDVLEGLQVMDLLQDPITKEAPVQVTAAIQAGKSVKDVRVAIELPDGDFVFAMMSVVPHVEEGVLIRVYGFFRDLTEIERVVTDLQSAIKREILNRPYDPDTAFFTRKAFVERLRYQVMVSLELRHPLGLIVVLIAGANARENSIPIAVVNKAALELRKFKRDAYLIGRISLYAFCLLVPGVRKSTLSSIVRRLNGILMTEPGIGESIPILEPFKITCEGLHSVDHRRARRKADPRYILSADAFLDDAEKKALMLRRDSGTFPAVKREPA
jgi:PAS domain S-box-containing protein